jgi:ribosomal protein S18 acetylase RimI-like enzyme
MEQTVAPFTESMVDAGTSAIARAFMGDPLFAWAIPDAATREQKIAVLHRVLLEYGLRYGLRITQSDGGRCVAIWEPPGHSMGLVGLARSGMATAPLKIGPGPMARLARAAAAIEPIREQGMGGRPHWYLSIAAIDPDLQGQGRGGALLREGLARVDADGLPCFLDTNNEANLSLYERFGFTTVARVQVGQDGPFAWGMRRDPQSAGAS